jgi:hypothetical protein
MQLSLVLAFVAALVTEAELRSREVRLVAEVFQFGDVEPRDWINRGWCDDADDRWVGGPFVRWCRFVGDTD